MSTTSVPHRSPRRHTVAGILFSMCLCLVLVIASVSALNLALPDLATDLDATTNDLTWIADAYTVALAALVLPLGALGDRIGRRKVLVLGCLVFGAAAYLGSLAETPEVLIGWRAVMGLGAAMIMPGTLSTITSALPAEKRSMGVAAWSGFAAAGAVLGLLAAGWILEHWEWDTIFHGSAVVASVAALASLILAPETKDDETQAFDVFGSLFLALGIGSLVFGIIEGSDIGWSDGRVVGAFALCLVSLAAYVLHGLKSAHPILDPRLFLRRGFSAGTVTVLTQFMAVFGFFYVGLQYLQLVLGWSALHSAVALLPVAAVVLPTAQCTPLLARALGQRAVAVTGLVCLAGALFWLSGLDTDSGYWPFLGGLVVAGLGIGLSSSTGTDMIVGSLGRNQQGVASAMNDTTREVGSAVGIALMGSVYDSHYSDGLPSLDRLPADAAQAVRDSAPAGLKVAEHLPAPIGQQLKDGVQHAFMDGFSAALWIVGVILVVGAALVLLRGPSRREKYRGKHIAHGHDGESATAAGRES